MFLLDSINGRPMLKKEDLTRAFDKMEKTLKEDIDISNVAVKKNWDDYIFSVSGNFVNLDALNKAINKINTLFNRTEKYDPVVQDNYSFANKIFTRLYNYDLINEYNSMPEKDKAIFDNAKYTTIYRFANTVGSFTNNNAMKSKNGKAIMLKVDVKDLITNNKTLKNSIHLN